MLNKKITGNVLGFDFGFKHIGIALGNTNLQWARPLIRLNAQDGIPNWNRINDLIIEWDIQAFIVGLPLNLDGSTQEVSLAAQKFSRKLTGRFKLPAFLVDERYTTKEARILHKKALEYDTLSAAIIIESWLRMQKNSE